MHNIGTIPTFRMHNIGTVPMFKIHNIGTPKIYNLCLVLEFRLYSKNKWPLVALVFLLESSMTHFQGLAPPIQSGMNWMDKEYSVKKVPFEKLVFSTQISTGMWALLFFQFLLSKYNFLIPSSVPKLNLVCK